MVTAPGNILGPHLGFMVTLLVLLLVTRVVAGGKRSPALRVHFANPRREALLALIPAAVLLGLTSTIFLGIASRAQRPASPTSDRAGTYTFTSAAGQLAANGIALAPFAVMLGVGRQRLETVGIGRHNLAPALLIAGVASVAAAAINHKLTGAFWLRQDTLWRVVAQLGVGISEEAIFRGYLQLRWAAWLNRSGWIVIAGLCTLWHAPAALANSGTGVPAMGSQLLTVLAAALTFGLCMRLTGNIAGLSVVHAVMNVVCDV